MGNRPTTRRSFFGLAGGAALLCTVGGERREYWIQAETVHWPIVPTHRDEWHNRRVPGRQRYRAFVYREMTEGFASYARPANIPGPTLLADVGDVLVVHFRNADDRLRQAVTM